MVRIWTLFKQCNLIQCYLMVLRSSIDLTKWSNLKCDFTEFNRVAIMLKSLVQQDYSEASVKRCSLEKVFCKYAANLQENTDALTLYWNHTSARVFSCKFAACFAEHLFLTTSLGGCFWLFKLVFMIYCFITVFWLCSTGLALSEAATGGVL